MQCTCSRTDSEAHQASMQRHIRQARFLPSSRMQDLQLGSPGFRKCCTSRVCSLPTALPLTLLGLRDVGCDSNAPDALGVQLLSSRLRSLGIDVHDCYRCASLPECMRKRPSNALATTCEAFTPSSIHYTPSNPQIRCIARDILWQPSSLPCEALRLLNSSPKSPCAAPAASCCSSAPASGALQKLCVN